MIIMFVRHAEAKNDKLTKLGKIQCRLAVKQKDKIKFEKIYCSPANRCVKTARYFQNKYKLPAEICENLAERQLLVDAVPQNDNEQEWYDNYMNPLYENDLPEGCKNYLTRSFVEFKRIVDENIKTNTNVIIVAHSCTIYALSAFVYGIEKDKNIQWMRVGNCSKVYYEINEKD